MTTINETLRMLPPEARRQVVDFVEFIAQKYLKKKVRDNRSREKILKFAGAWKDMREEDYKGFIDDIYDRRKRSFSRRRET